ncbi:MAG: site-specific DNA-methyltransferase [Desulfitobacterium sp.]
MMDKPKFETPSLTTENVAKIAELFPGAVTEGKVNFDLLRSLLGDEVYGDEAYEFTWVGKKAAIAEAGRPIRKTLRPCVEESKAWDTTENLYIEGDNLDVLKLLQESYLGKVKMIYIDPPYNTGNDTFIYPDNYTQAKEVYEEQIELFDQDGDRLFRNTESNGRFHSDWCSMMYPRLVLARNLLSDNGVIFISIDDNEVAQLRKLCDEVFGESNFVCEFIWKSKLGKVGTTSTISATHEYIICYSKHLSELSFKMIETPNDGRKESLRQWGQADRREDRPSMWYPITIEGVEVYPIKEDGTEGRWRVGQETAKELLEKGLLSLSKKDGKYNIHRTFESGVSVTPYDTFLLDNIGTTAKGATMLSSLGMSKMFDYSKPVELLHFFAELCTKGDDIILDFFSGSATTAHAVMQLNAEDGGKRKFIMVQLPEACAEGTEAAKAGYNNICEIGKERIRRAEEKIKEEAGLTAQNLDIGFRVLKLDDTNMKDVYYAAGEYTQDLLSGMEDNIKDDRNDMDLLYACLLDWGLPLSMPHTHEKIDGFTVHAYNEGDLIACFNKHISDAVVKEIAKRKPLLAVFRDSSFTSSPEKINVEEIFKLLAPNTNVRVI